MNKEAYEMLALRKSRVLLNKLVAMVTLEVIEDQKKVFLPFLTQLVTAFGYLICYGDGGRGEMWAQKSRHETYLKIHQSQ